MLVLNLSLKVSFMSTGVHTGHDIKNVLLPFCHPEACDRVLLVLSTISTELFCFIVSKLIAWAATLPNMHVVQSLVLTLLPSNFFF